MLLVAAVVVATLGSGGNNDNKYCDSEISSKDAENSVRQGGLARRCGKQGNVASKAMWQGDVARRCGKAMWQGDVTRQCGK